MPEKRAEAEGKCAGGPPSHPQNPRYFTDGAKADETAKAVYLTGSHT